MHDIDDVHAVHDAHNVPLLRFKLHHGTQYTIDN